MMRLEMASPSRYLPFLRVIDTQLGRTLEQFRLIGGGDAARPVSRTDELNVPLLEPALITLGEVSARSVGIPHKVGRTCVKRRSSP